MARVKGKKGTINEGAVGDVPVVAGLDYLGDHGENYEEGDVAPDVKNLAQAIVRGDEISHPADRAVVEKEKLEDRAHDVDLTGDVKAKKGAHVLSKSERDEAAAVSRGGGDVEDKATDVEAPKKSKGD